MVKRNKSNFQFIIILCSFLILIFLFLGYFDGGSLNKLFVSPSPSSSVVDMKDWKTYTNNDLGFSVQYPPDKYSIVVQPLVTNEQRFITIKPTDLFGKKQPLALTYSVSIASVESSNNSFSNTNQLFGNGPLLKYVEDENTRNFPIIQTSLGGEKALRVNGCCGGQNGIESDIFAIHNNKIYEIVVEPSQVTGDPLPNKEIYEQILSTFKFTN